MLKVKNPDKTEKAIVVVCALMVFAAGIFWINFNNSGPKYDQKIIYAEARRLAGYLREPFNITYMTFYKRQRGFVLCMAATLKIFGDAQTSVGILNVIGCVAAYAGICKTVHKTVKDKRYFVFTSIVLTLFYPLVIYTTFMYGTLLSLTFSVWGVYAVIAYCDTLKNRYAVLAAIGFSIGILMHQSAAVAAVAGIIYFLLHINRTNAVKNCITVAFIIFFIFMSLHLTNIIYEKLTGAAGGDSVPVTTTIYMGLNSETQDGGPGSQDGSFTNLFYENGNDGDKTNKDAVERIKLVILDYITGKRSLSFFIRKTEYQWMDPTMGARKTIIPNDVNLGEPPNSEAFIRFYNSGFRTIIFKVSDIFMILVYGFALISGVFTLIYKNEMTEDRSIHFLIQLFFIGGFTFQLMWESLARYCFPYFVWLIPEAIYGIHQLYQLIPKVRKTAKAEN
ncbi:MAG: glycosyltransferase family 39 protein [Lachnospiraceae bacterium]|nr:glycosyltransferase family 39 protein [Lachnospiraceae bacterium]